MTLVKGSALRHRVPGVSRALVFAMEFQTAVMDLMNSTAQVFATKLKKKPVRIAGCSSLDD